MFDGAASCSLSLRAARVPAHKHNTGPALFLPSVDFLKNNSSTHVFFMTEKKKGGKKSTFMRSVLLRRNNMRRAMTAIFDVWKCGQLYLPHKSPWLRAKTLHFVLSTAFTFYCVRFFSEWSILNHKILGSCLPIQISWGCRVSALSATWKRPEHLFSIQHSRSVRASTYPDTLRILWKSHMSPLRRHSNNLRTITHFSLIMQMKQGSRPVACRQKVNTGETPYNTDQLPSGWKCMAHTFLETTVVGAKFETEMPYTYGY